MIIFVLLDCLCEWIFYVYLCLQTHLSQIAPWGTNKTNWIEDHNNGNNRSPMQGTGWEGTVKCAVSTALTMIMQTHLEDEAFFVSALQRKATEPQVVGAVLGQLPQETRHALWRGSRHAHTRSDVKLNALRRRRLHIYRWWTKYND